VSSPPRNGGGHEEDEACYHQHQARPGEDAGAEFFLREGVEDGYSRRGQEVQEDVEPGAQEDEAEGSRCRDGEVHQAHRRKDKCYQTRHGRNDGSTGQAVRDAAVDEDKVSWIGIGESPEEKVDIGDHRSEDAERDIRLVAGGDRQECGTEGMGDRIHS
jgi:hypothetical protein